MLPTWHQMPEDAGQIVDVSYAIDWEEEMLYRRTYDRGDRTLEIDRARVDGGSFEPWNDCLPNIVGEWEDVVAISISICPTSLEFPNGDMYDEDNLLEAIQEYAKSEFPGGVQFTCLQIGWQQGDEWATINGDKEAGEEFLGDFFRFRGADEDLFVDKEASDEEHA
jgi:hypothetical protein